MTVTPLPRPMKTWRMTGSMLLDRFAEAGAVDRHVAPAEQDLAFVLDRALDLVFAGEARRRFLGQEHHADAVLARRRQAHALRGHLLAEERVGNLDQDAGAVAGERIGADRAAMGEVAQDLQTLLDDRVAFLALDVRDEADAAGVVLVGGVVETLRAVAAPEPFTGMSPKSR